MEKEIIIHDSENTEFKIVVKYDYIPSERIEDWMYEIPLYVEDYENCYLSWTLLPDQILPDNYLEQLKEYEQTIKNQL